MQETKKALRGFFVFLRYYLREVIIKKKSKKFSRGKG